jgi:hypothetical protein
MGVLTSSVHHRDIRNICEMLVYPDLSYTLPLKDYIFPIPSYFPAEHLVNHTNVYQFFIPENAYNIKELGDPKDAEDPNAKRGSVQRHA